LAEDPTLWDDPDAAQKLMKERTNLDNAISNVREIENELQSNIDMIEMAESESEPELVTEAEKAIEQLGETAADKQIDAMLSGEVDGNDAYLSINAGSGGTEAQDWAQMLLRMYVRWSEKKGYKVETLEASDGEEAGLKSVTIHVKGDKAYGWLKSETGVHRLVRISPFDSNAKRHTSFSAVNVSPVIDDSFEVDINEVDLKIDTYRSSGAGGQHVNTTDSAVRITHLPTGIVVACQNQRSQHKNRDEAMKMLKARIYEAEMARREAEKTGAHEEKTDIGWGHQIRSYVLQPYQMVKDLRTNTENTDSSGVLDGDIDRFMKAYLVSGLEDQA